MCRCVDHSYMASLYYPITDTDYTNNLRWDRSMKYGLGSAIDFLQFELPQQTFELSQQTFELSQQTFDLSQQTFDIPSYPEERS